MAPKKKNQNKKAKTPVQLSLFEDDLPPQKQNKPVKSKKKVASNKKIVSDLAIDSTDLINEPEFDGFYFRPDELVSQMLFMLNENEEKKDKKDIGNKEIWEKIYEESINEFFIEELYLRLQDLRDRIKHNKRSKMLKKVDAVLKMIDPVPAPVELLKQCGLIMALVTRNIVLGHRLIEISLSVAQKGSIDEVPISMTEEQEEYLEKEMEKLSAEFPGLNEFFALKGQDIQTVEILGSLLINGEIVLYIFSDEQLKGAVRKTKKIFQNQFGMEIPNNNLSLALDLLDDNQIVEFQQEITNYVAKLVDDSLLENLELAFTEILEDEELDDELFDLIDSFLDELPFLDAHYLMFILSSAFLGELQEFFQEAYGNNKNGPDNIFQLN